MKLNELKLKFKGNEFPESEELDVSMYAQDEDASLNSIMYEIQGDYVYIIELIDGFDWESNTCESWDEFYRIPLIKFNKDEFIEYYKNNGFDKFIEGIDYPEDR